MQLTNYSFLDSRNNYLSAKSFHKVAMQRLSTGTKLERAGSDAGALSQSMRSRFEMMGDRSFITNLQNTRSFLHSQEAGLNKALETYNRMEEISIRATDPTLRQSDRYAYSKEFAELQGQLSEIMKGKFNGRRLFNDTLVCGGSKDIPLGQLDLAGGKPAGIKHAVRAQEVDVNSPAGTISFRVNSGTEGDIYRVWMGNTCVFSAGGAFAGPDHTQAYDFANGASTFDYNDPNEGWRTSGSAFSQDDDLIEVKFAPGKPTEYRITPGDTNDNGRQPLDGSLAGSVADDGISDFNSPSGTPGQYDNLPVTLYDNIITNDLPASATSTMLTLQIETESIGVIYAEGNSANNDADNSGTPAVSFVPDIFELPVTIDIHGNQMGLDPKGFGTVDGESPVAGAPHTLDTVAAARDTLDHLRGNKYSDGSGASYYGEEKCIVSERLAAVGAEINRINLEIEGLQNQVVHGEQSIGRISDADMAREATQLAKASLKLNLAEQIMSKSARLKDILIPLTTNHHRGAVLSSTL
jgi:flagellin-like hook-associated protein FlgL